MLPTVLSFLFALIMISDVIISGAMELEKPLAEIFRTGRVRFIREITINDDSMSLRFHSLRNAYRCPYGYHLRTIGRAGQEPGEFNYPIEVEFSKERLFVREIMNSRVSIFDKQGTFIKSVHINMLEGQWQNMRALPDRRMVVQRDYGNSGVDGGETAPWPP